MLVGQPVLFDLNGRFDPVEHRETQVRAALNHVNTSKAVEYGGCVGSDRRRDG